MIYAYMRLSTNEDKQKNSFIIQKDHINKVHTIDKFFNDSTSGSTPFDKRSGWMDLMAIVKKGDVIIAHRIDRVSRSMLNYLVAEQQLLKMGVKLIFVEGVRDEDSPEALLLKNMLLVMAEFERSMIKQRIIQSKAKCKSEGKYLGGDTPYGFSNENGALVANEEEQEVVSVMQGLRSSGLSYNKIADSMNQSKYETRTRGKWFSTQISRILKINKKEEL